MEALDSMVEPPDPWSESNPVNLNSTNDFAATNLAFQLCLGSLYVLVFILGSFGNALVAFVVIRSVHMRTVTNIFIANLAFSDILLCFLGVPFTPLYTFMGRWIFGDLLCHLLAYSQGVCIYISTFTLTSIAADRFHVILFPLKPRMKLTTCVFMIVAIWFSALLLTSPYGMYMNLRTIGETDYCEEQWPEESWRRIFSTFTTIMQFAVPFSIIAVCYVCVSLRLNRRTKNRPGCSNSKREEADRERNRKTNRMLIAMVVIFAVSWMPFNLCNVLVDFYPEAEEWRYYKALFFVCHLIAMSSTCYNPFLYAWLNDNFKKEFKLVLPCFRRVPEHRSRNGSGPSANPGRGGLGDLTEGNGHRRDRMASCNGDGGINAERTVQETLLPDSRRASRQYSGCEMIGLEPTTTFEF